MAALAPVEAATEEGPVIRLPMMVFDPGTDLGIGYVIEDDSTPGGVRVQTATRSSPYTTPLGRAMDHSSWVVDMIARLAELGEATGKEMVPQSLYFLDSMVAAQGYKSVFSQGVLIGAIAGASYIPKVGLIPEMKARLKVVGGRSKRAVLEWTKEAGLYREGMESHEAEVLVGVQYLLLGWRIVGPITNGETVFKQPVE